MAVWCFLLKHEFPQCLLSKHIGLYTPSSDFCQSQFDFMSHQKDQIYNDRPGDFASIHVGIYRVLAEEARTAGWMVLLSDPTFMIYL